MLAGPYFAIYFSADGSACSSLLTSSISTGKICAHCHSLSR